MRTLGCLGVRALSQEGERGTRGSQQRRWGGVAVSAGDGVSGLWGSQDLRLWGFSGDPHQKHIFLCCSRIL